MAVSGGYILNSGCGHEGAYVVMLAGTQASWTNAGCNQPASSGNGATQQPVAIIEQLSNVVDSRELALAYTRRSSYSNIKPQQFSNSSRQQQPAPASITKLGEATAA